MVGATVGLDADARGGGQTGKGNLNDADANVFFWGGGLTATEPGIRKSLTTKPLVLSPEIRLQAGPPPRMFDDPGEYLFRPREAQRGVQKTERWLQERRR